jgi:hypothetical protein
MGLVTDFVGLCFFMGPLLFTGLEPLHYVFGLFIDEILMVTEIASKNKNRSGRIGEVYNGVSYYSIKVIIPEN